MNYNKPQDFLEEPVSILVALKNEAHNVNDLITNLLKQKYTHFEVILIDDYSDDDTLSKLRLLVKDYTNITLLEPNYSIENSSKKKALSQAINMAKNKILLFTDADCIPKTDFWIQSMINHLKGKDIVLGVSPYFYHKSFIGDVIAYETMITYLLYSTATLFGIPYMGVGRNMMIRKEILLSNDIYDSHEHVLGGDDDLTVNKLATKWNTVVNLDPKSYVYSKPLSVYSLRFFQKTRHFSVGKYYSLKSKLFLGSINFSWIGINLIFIVSLFINVKIMPIISLHILRTFLLFTIFGSLPKWGIKHHPFILKTIYLDVVYSLELLVLGPLGVLSKKIIWQKKKNFQKKPYKTLSS